MKYRFMTEHRDEFSLSKMCRVFEISRAGFYKWQTNPVSKHDKEDERLLVLIQDSHTASGGIYGSPRVFLDLQEIGETCGKNRIAKIMSKNRIRGASTYPRHRYTKGKSSLIYPNTLNREFTTTRPNQAWVSDITFIRTWQGWLYLAVVLDLFSRKVIGWSMKPTIHRDIVLDAIMMAVHRRRPKGNTIVHSDQGSQYSSHDWDRFCRANNLEPSMSRKGNCWDNAVAESFFGNLKKEKIKERIYKTRDLARADVFEYVELFYNKKRRHKHLGGVSPDEFERALINA